MRLIGPGEISSRAVYPILGVVLLLALACGASAPATGVLTGSDSAEPAQSKAEPSGGAVAAKAGAQAKAEPSVGAAAEDAGTQAKAELSVGAAAVDAGHKVGQQIADFNITLIDGTRVTSVELLAQRQPTFLFFFETW